MKRCKGCERAPRFCGALVDGYCGDCRQIPLPFRAAAEAVAEGKKPEPLGACDDCDQGAHCRLPAGKKCLRHLKAGPAVRVPKRRARALEGPSVRPRPSMMDLGWSCKMRSTELWTHRSGASVEFRGSGPLGNRAARLNGGPWEPVKEFFWVTIDRALRRFKEARP